MTAHLLWPLIPEHSCTLVEGSEQPPPGPGPTPASAPWEWDRPQMRAGRGCWAEPGVTFTPFPHSGQLSPPRCHWQLTPCCCHLHSPDPSPSFRLCVAAALQNRVEGTVTGTRHLRMGDKGSETDSEESAQNLPTCLPPSLPRGLHQTPCSPHTLQDQRSGPPPTLIPSSPMAFMKAS